MNPAAVIVEAKVHAFGAEAKTERIRVLRDGTVSVHIGGGVYMCEHAMTHHELVHVRLLAKRKFHCGRLRSS
jgi:hypothetical protein